MIPGLVITPQGCTATDFGPDAVTVNCAFTVTNNGNDTLVVGVAAVDPSGAILSIQPLQLLPGAAPVSIPAPPAGGTWLVAAQTQGHLEWNTAWHFVLALLVGGLAGLGLAGVIGLIIRSHQRWD